MDTINNEDDQKMNIYFFPGESIFSYTLLFRLDFVYYISHLVFSPEDYNILHDNIGYILCDSNLIRYGFTETKKILITHSKINIDVDDLSIEKVDKKFEGYLGLELIKKYALFHLLRGIYQYCSNKQ